MKRAFRSLTLLALVLSATPAFAQSLGTFRWQLQPYGSVLEISVTQQGGIFLLDGIELQCGGNASLPVNGVAVPQENGSVILGLTTINEQGRGIHTRATINTPNFNGFWSDNAGNTNQTFLFNPGVTCPGGPRTGPNSPTPTTRRANPAGSDCRPHAPASPRSRAASSQPFLPTALIASALSGQTAFVFQPPRRKTKALITARVENAIVMAT